MPRYRKKPVVIDAFRLGSDDEPEWFGTPKASNMDDDGIVIPTLEGDMLARWGDWVIRGVQGEIYPCRDDIFQATYEPVSEGDE